MTDPFEAFFEENAGQGGGAPSFKFGDIGSGVIGTVVSQKQAVVKDIKTREPKLDKNGNQQPQLNVVLQTELRNWDKVAKIPKDANQQELPASEDTGLRAVYVKHRMIDAVFNALKADGAKKLETGGVLGVKKSGEIPTAFENGIPEYQAKYTKPAPSAASDSFFDSAASATPTPEPVAAQSQSDEPPF